MVATTRTGLNIWIGERVKECSNHTQDSAHEFRLLCKLFARKKKGPYWSDMGSKTTGVPQSKIPCL